LLAIVKHTKLKSRLQANLPPHIPTILTTSEWQLIPSYSRVNTLYPFKVIH